MNLEHIWSYMTGLWVYIRQKKGWEPLSYMIEVDFYCLIC